MGTTVTRQRKLPEGGCQCNLVGRRPMTAMVSARLAQQTRVGRGRRGMSVERREGILVVRLT
jgi:hypothetical protein